MVGSPPYVLWWWFLLWQLLLIIFFSFQEAKGIKIGLYTPQLYAGQLHKVEASLHCPNTAAPHLQVSFPYGNCKQKFQKKITLCFSKTKLIEDTNILHPLPDQRLGILGRHLSHVKISSPIWRAKAVPSLLSYFKALSISQAPRIKPCDIGLCSQALYQKNSYFYTD